MPTFVMSAWVLLSVRAGGGVHRGPDGAGVRGWVGAAEDMFLVLH